ncbi:hypothetical protein GCM10012275_28290 [Longimycelium tulufanense]|uniref:Uncharacterized protein n=1 Tax=Longimycelium tulufanense TaxID=907463 RepID=A0A8J3CG36_9PSEU|nr:hypothetical protein [Longimycelium tulufanense]GGM55511.1 hypothetical protein GCM10012275_28290 [Longimycelium tulufanense]
MALGDTYATLAELKDRLNTDKPAHDDELKLALESASRSIEKHLGGRQFNDAVTASARRYYPLHSRLVFVDDFHELSTLVVKSDTAEDGTYATTIDASEYQAEPLDGIHAGLPGWPFWMIRLVGDELFLNTRRPSVQVTARWGWSAVPAPVKEATLALAVENFKMKFAPFGVAGMTEFGTVRVRENPKIARMVEDYQIDKVMVA